MQGAVKDMGGQTRGSVRAVLQLEGAAVFGLCVALYGWTGASWGLFAALVLIPDLSMLGYLGGPRTGAWAYNLGHSYLGPVGLGLAGWLGLPGLIPLALIWAAHIGADRALGYGLKYPTAFRATHLGGA